LTLPEYLFAGALQVISPPTIAGEAYTGYVAQQFGAFRRVK
jgi:hypothetical protein